jgi:FecR protein
VGGWQKPSLAWLVLAAYLFPAPVFAQATKAGVVTTLEGNVTAVRTVAPQPVPLKFRDDVFVQDRVVTGDQSFARLLLGGKAVISIRERSSVTITEVPGRSTVEIESGKIALSVARDRMLPGEILNIRTPNAVAGVRGTVVVAQVTFRQGPGGVRQPLSDLWVIRGLAEATHISLAGVPLSPAVPLGARESFRADPTTAAKGSFTPEQIGRIVEGLQPQQPQDPGTASQRPARLEAINATMSLLTSLTGQQLATGLFPEITIPTDTTPKQTVTEVMDSTSSPIVLSTTPLPPPTSNVISLQSSRPNPQPGVTPGCEARSPNGSRDQGRWMHGRPALDDGLRGQNPRALSRDHRAEDHR